MRRPFQVQGPFGGGFLPVGKRRATRALLRWFGGGLSRFPAPGYEFESLVIFRPLQRPFRVRLANVAGQLELRGDKGHLEWIRERILEAEAGR